MVEPYEENINENIERSRKNTEQLLKLQKELKLQLFDAAEYFRKQEFNS